MKNKILIGISIILILISVLGNVCFADSELGTNLKLYGHTGSVFGGER